MSTKPDAGTTPVDGGPARVGDSGAQQPAVPGWKVASTPRTGGSRRSGDVPSPARFAPRFIRLLQHRPWARALVWGCFLSFAVLAGFALIGEGLLLAVDRGVEQSVVGMRSGPLNTTMVVLTFLGTRWVIGALTLALMVWSAITGKARLLTGVVVLAVVINPAVEFGFKELIDRARPDMAQLVAGRGPSFPSGHVLAGAGFYGMAPLVAWEATRSRVTQRCTLIGSLLVILTIAASRIYLDVHWTTDVVAGLLLATALVAAAGHLYLARKRSGAAPPGGSARDLPRPSPTSTTGALDRTSGSGCRPGADPA